MSVDLGTLTRRLVNTTEPVLLTKIGPLGTLGFLRTPTSFEQVGEHTHLKYEKRLRSYRPQGR